MKSALPPATPHSAAGAACSRRWLTVVCVLLSLHFAVAYSTLTTPMVAFRPTGEFVFAGNPFDYRMLPKILWMFAAFLLEPLHAHFPRLHLPNLQPPFSSNAQWFVVLLTFTSMLGTLTVARRLLRRIDGLWGFEWLALGMAYAAYFDTILVLNRNLYYPYDIPGLFFFTLLIYLAYVNRPFLFALALIPATLNKETACMAILVYFGLQWGHRKRTILFSLCGGFAIVFITVRWAQHIFIRRSCPMCTAAFQNQIHTNVQQMHNPFFWFSESAVFGYAYIALLFFWRYIPAQMRWTALGTYALWLAAMGITGVLREVRIFSELSGLLLLLVGTGVHQWLQTKIQPDPAASRKLT